MFVKLVSDQKKIVLHFPHDLQLEDLNHEPEDAGGLADKERAFRYGMIKGRIAETLIKELFLSLGYNVFRRGKI